MGPARTGTTKGCADGDGRAGRWFGRGQRCNPAKLLLDPYAKAIDGQIDGDESLFGYRFDARDERNDTDSLGHTMLAVVTDTGFDWGDDRAPDLAYHHTVIYEAHVRGLTQTHPDLPEEIRGTYAGIGHPAITDDSFLILFNGHHEPVEFRLPGTAIGRKWHVAVDTVQDGETGPDLRADDSVHLEARSTLVLIRP